VVRAIALDCHNRKCGAAARAKMIELSRAYQSALWEALCVPGSWFESLFEVLSLRSMIVP